MVPAALEANAAFVFLKKLQDFYAGQLAHGLAINLVQEITWSDWVREVFLDFWLHLTNHRRGRPSNEDSPDPVLTLWELIILLRTALQGLLC